MNKLKYILLIAGSVVAGIVIGWLIFSGGSVEVKLPDITIVRDTQFIPYADTFQITRTRIKFDTVRAVDSIFVVTHDTLYPFNIKNAAYPFNIGNNLYLTEPFELAFEFYDRKDTIIPTFYFPNMIADVVWKHGSDSIAYKFETIYKDYWYNNTYVELAKDMIILTGGYLLSTIGSEK